MAAYRYDLGRFGNSVALWLGGIHPGEGERGGAVDRAGQRQRCCMCVCVFCHACSRAALCCVFCHACSRAALLCVCVLSCVLESTTGRGRHACVASAHVWVWGCTMVVEA